MLHLRSFRMLGSATVAAGLAALAAIAQGGGEVAHAQYGGGTPVNVNAYACIVLGGGHRAVPAGSEVVIRSGWTTLPKGGIESFLGAQTTLVSIADGPMLDVSGDYGEPFLPPAGTWTTLIHRTTGVTLHAAGDTMRFTFTLLLNRRLTDVFDLDGDGAPDPTNGGPGLSFGGTCTVRAV